MAKAERNGKRKKRSTFQTRVPDLGYYFIVTDTNETEANYLYGLRDSLPQELQGRIVIKVSKAKTDELVRTCKEQASMEPQFGQPWIVFDRDKVVPFDQIIADASREGIRVGWSNPCIEIWLEYQKSNKQIYTLLNRYGDEKKAVEIAENRLRQYQKDGFEKPSDMCPCTTVQQLIGEIKGKIENL